MGLKSKAKKPVKKQIKKKAGEVKPVKKSKANKPALDLTKFTKEGKPRKPMGRPSTYTRKLGDLLCDTIQHTSKSLKRICEQDEKLPTYASVKRWLKKYPDFRTQYAEAKDLQAHYLGDELLEIADDGTNDTMTIKLPGGFEKEVEDREWTSRSKLRVDTRKWLMSKLLPKKYGDKLDLTSDNKPLNTPALNIKIDGKDIILE